MIVCKSKTELDMMREAGRIAALTDQELAAAIRPAITTQELDEIAEVFIRSHAALPSFKGYNGFSASICTSVNEELVHGIPASRSLQDGDIISIDIGANIYGIHGDSAWTYPVGLISETAVGHAVQKHVEASGFSVVRDYVGDGIGTEMHEDPQIHNYGPPGKGPTLKVGITLAIEPMVNVGTYQCNTLADDWTVITADGSLAAHFEHTVAVTEDGPVIMSQV